MNNGATYVEFSSFSHTLHAKLESGSIQNAGDGCTGQDDDGTKHWDWAVLARDVPEGYDYVICHDKFNLTDAGWGCLPNLRDPDQPDGTPGYWEIVIKVNK
jgi:hypothetical protein